MFNSLFTFSAVFCSTLNQEVKAFSAISLDLGELCG
jgi:hypothetical protein